MWKTLGGFAAVFAGSVAGSFGLSFWLSSPELLHAQQVPPLPAAPVSDFTPDRFEGIVAKVGPSVVAVDAMKPASANAKGKAQEESGSGVLVRLERGICVVTNNHVIAGASSGEITVTLQDGRILRPSRVWADPESDVALLAVEASNLLPATVGDSDRLRVGHWVLAFGSPFGLNQTVTHGIISAKDRGQISLGTSIRIKEFLQTDAAINPGSSGGPLVNTEGAVIGINTAIASNNGNSSGVAFSIPINLVKRIARELMEKGSVTRGYLGVQLAPVLDPNEALRLGLDRVRGALVETVHPQSPAANGGLKPGDVILKLESVSLRDENHLINLVSNLPPRQKVRLDVWRGRELQRVEVMIGDWPAAAKPR